MRRRRNGLHIRGCLGRCRGDLLGRRATPLRDASKTSGALPHLFGTTRDAANDALHAAIEAVGELRHHRRAFRLGYGALHELLT